MIFVLAAAIVYGVAAWVPRVSVSLVTLGFFTVLVASLAPTDAFRPTLFAAPNGFLALAPAMYVAAIGAVLRVGSRPAEAVAAVTALTLWPITHTSLVPAVALLAPGLCAVAHWGARKPFLAVAPLVLGAIAWNDWLMVQYTIGTIPKDAPFSFAAMVRQQADVSTSAPYVYPFAFPGNVISAWREGVPVARYDELSAEPQREHFEIAFDRGADRFLLDGWGNAATSTAGAFRTVAADRAVMVFPFAPAVRSIELSILATVRGAEPGSVDAAVAINGVTVGRFNVHLQQPTQIRFTIPASDVGRVFRAGYNRLSIVSSAPRRLAIHRIRLAPAS
jgi:hypothetical protein